MKRLLCALFLYALSADAQVVVTQGVVSSAVLAAGGGAGDFCSTAPTNIFCLDLEPSATCTANGADTVTGAPDCQYTTSPLDGSVSMRATDNSDTQDDALWSNDFSTASDVRVTFSFYVEADDGATSSHTVISLREGATRTMEVQYSPATGLMKATSPSNGTTSADTGAISIVTEYEVCIEYDTDGRKVRIRVDPAEDRDCSGTTTSGNHSDTGSAEPATLDDLRIHPDIWDFSNGFDHGDTRIDDVLIEEISITL